MGLSRRFICCLVVSVSTSDPFLTSSIIGIIFALSIVMHMLCTPYATSFLNVIELVNLVCVLLSASANMVAFGTKHDAVIEYAAAIYVFAQICFMLTICIVIYSAVIQKLVSNYASVSVEGTNYARHDTGIDFDSDGHTSLMIGSIFYAVTYGLIGPAILLIMYYRGMKARKGALKSYYFGFLVKGYDKDFFWWEYTVLSRRFICCLVVSVSTSAPFLTSSIIGIIFALSIVMHML